MRNPKKLVAGPYLEKNCSRGFRWTREGFAWPKVSGGGETGSGRLRPGGSSIGIQNENHEWKDGNGEKIGGKGGEMGVEQVGKKGE